MDAIDTTDTTRLHRPHRETRRRVVAAALMAGLLAGAGTWPAQTYAASRRQAKGRKEMQHRLGIVVFQFDDGTAGHYTHAFTILNKYGLKGSFGVVTGILDKPGRLTRAQVKEMHEAGHEIHDHTLRHDAAFWGNPANQQEWLKRIDESLAILRDLGIRTRGWNQPGGKGQGWSEPLRLTLSRHYDYAAGRVALRPEQVRNIHWRLRDDPLSLGRGGVSSWGYNGGKGDPVKETECIKTLIADGIQHGLVVIPLWHRVRQEDGTAQGLEDICAFVRDHRLPTMVMADAVNAVQNPRKHFNRRAEQIGNPHFLSDIDGNGRPDGYLKCRYAGEAGARPREGRVVEFGPGATTWIYGPEPGRSQFTLLVRSPEAAPVTVKPVLTFTDVSDTYEYGPARRHICAAKPAGATWQELSFPVNVDKQVDRVKIEIALYPGRKLLVQPASKLLVQRASWRVVR